jgi:HlyD family secretion protein
MEAARPPLDAAAPGRKLGATAIVLSLAVVVLIAAASYVVYERYLARPAVPPIVGTRVQVAKGSIASGVAATGSVVSTRQSKLTMQVAGRLQELPVKLGDEVKAGALLAKVDSRPLELRLQQANSGLKTAQLRRDQLKQGARPEEIAQAEAAVQSAQGRLSDLQAGPPSTDVAAAQAAAETSGAAVRQAQAKLDAVRVGATSADVSAAEQAVKAAQANLDRANADLAKLSAPSDDELAPLRTMVDKAQAAVKVAQANYDKIGWRPDAAARQESAVLQQATLDYQNALAQLRLKQQPRQSDVEVGQRAVESAQAQVAAAQAKLAQLQAGPTAEDVRQAQAGVEAAQAAYQAGLARVESVRQGAKPGEIQAAQASVAQAQQALALKRSAVTAADLALAEEQIAAAEIAVKQAQLDLDNARLVAPYDGVVGAITANLGEQVGPTSTILTLFDPKATRVDFGVDEADIAKVQVGKPAQIVFDAMPDKRYAGKVVGIAPNAVAQGGVASYTVSVGIDDATFSGAPGLTANVNVVAAQKDGVIVVPNRAIRRTGRGQIVDVVMGERTEARPIKTGLLNDQMTEIVEGLAENETVVIPGSALAPRPAAPAAGR